MLAWKDLPNKLFEQLKWDGSEPKKKSLKKVLTSGTTKTLMILTMQKTWIKNDLDMKSWQSPRALSAPQIMNIQQNLWLCWV